MKFAIFLLTFPLFAADFATDVWPILQDNCIKCHKAPYMDGGKLKKPKGDLRLDGPSHMRDTFVAGNAAESSLFTRTTLDKDHDDVMPPKGDLLTAKQQAILMAWIDGGATFAGWHGSDADPKLVRELRKEGGAILLEADGLTVRLRGMGARANDAFVKRLEPLADHIVNLDLTNTGISDAALKTVARMKNLDTLRIANSAITDAGLAELKLLRKLKLLSVYCCKDVTNAALAQLPPIATLYAAKTGITKKPAGVETHLGWDLKSVDAITTAAYPNSAAFLKRPGAKGKASPTASPEAKPAKTITDIPSPPKGAGRIAWDFEDGLQGWSIVSGLLKLPVANRTHMRNGNKPMNKEGKQYLTSLEYSNSERGNDDGQLAVVESPRFKLAGAKIQFAVSGGSHAATRVALCTEDGTEVRKEQGRNSEAFTLRTLNVPELVGKTVFLRVTDAQRGSWGHICLDAVSAAGEITGPPPAKSAAPPVAVAKRKPKPQAKPKAPAQQISKSGIRHSILVTGSKTAIIGEDNAIEWEGPGGSRDGYVLDNGNILITFSREVKEFTRDKKVVFHYKLAAPNKEISTSQRLKNGHTMIVEMGAKPRIREVAPDGKIAHEVALQPETSNTHMQTRMARKLPNGNYLCPHLLAFAIKEYAPDGKVVKVIKTDLEEIGGRKAENWPFTAVRLPNGHTVANLTHGNKTAIFDADGKLIWTATNEDVAGRFADPCGGQVLPNGNVVITSYAQRNPAKAKLFELNADKEVVWEYIDPRYKSAHGIHILTTNGESVRPAMK